MSAIGHLFCRKLSALSVAVSIGLIAQPVFASNAQVELVPYDTAFYFGTGRPVAVDDFFALLPDIFSEETLSEFLPETENLESQKNSCNKSLIFLKTRPNILITGALVMSCSLALIQSVCYQCYELQLMTGNSNPQFPGSKQKTILSFRKSLTKELMSES